MIPVKIEYTFECWSTVFEVGSKKKKPNGKIVFEANTVEIVEKNNFFSKKTFLLLAGKIWPEGIIFFEDVTHTHTQYNSRTNGITGIQIGNEI